MNINLKDFSKEWIRYLKWALLQHFLIINVIVLPFSLLTWKLFDIGFIELAPFGIAVFCAVHFPNPLLMILTAAVTWVFYPFIFFSMVNEPNIFRFIGASALLLTVHAAVGSILKMFGFEMRVLFNYPRFDTHTAVTGVIVQAVLIILLVLFA